MSAEQSHNGPRPLDQILPTREAMLSSIAKTGRAYDRRLSTQRVPLGYNLTHLDNGKPVPALVDKEIMQNIPRIHAVDSNVQQALIDLRKKRFLLWERKISTESTLPYLERKLAGKGVIIGFSGYATAGFGYEAEGEGMKRVLEEFRGKNIPIDLAVDGGTSLGIPGLNFLLSHKAGFETLGCVPLEGLRSVAPHDALIVKGTHYGDETDLVGTIPDILFILGGGPNSTKEYQAAINAGNTVVMLKLKDYPPTSLANTYQNVFEEEATGRLKREGRLFVCDSLDNIGSVVELLTTRDRIKSYHARRGQKSSFLSNSL